MVMTVMTLIPRFKPTRHVAFLVFPDFQLLDLSGPLAAFQVAGQASAGAYSVSVMSEEGGRGG
jgi:transcriptional regulator GlxA family with amidase domain